MVRGILDNVGGLGGQAGVPNCRSERIYYVSRNYVVPYVRFGWGPVTRFTFSFWNIYAFV